MRRPKLTRSISIDDFRAHYWLKEELIAFCRAQGIGTSGGKIEIARRISQFLDTGQTTSPRKSRNQPPAAAMPENMTRGTVIGAGWRCSEPVREFYEREIGRSFRFNAAMREFIHRGAGRTLGDGILVWEKSQRAPKGSSSIAPQFEFNRHMRAYFRENPGGSHAGAVKAWKQAKAARGRRQKDA